jgi:sugar O-acyltransferase (sialic acid O-acetyltransferase NeuD family)
VAATARSDLVPRRDGTSAIGLELTTEAVIWGGTGQAKVVCEALGSGFSIVAIFDNDEERTSPLSGVPVFHGPAGFARWKAEHGNVSEVCFVVAIGGDRGRDRVAIQDRLAGEGLLPVRLVHPRAFVAGNARVEAGSQVLAQAAVGVEAELGRGCIVNTGATVDHECVLGAGVHVAPGAHLAGSVHVEDFAMIGIGAVVAPRIRVGKDAVVGAGAVVVNDVEPGSVVVGNPARPLKRGQK